MAKAKKMDRRVQRTRQLLQDALIAMVIEKGYDATTVQDIIDRANVGRATFYAHFPDKQTNIVPIQLSLGAYNAMQQSDVHSYWEFNYTTNWIHPLYELPFTGGFPDNFGQPPDTFEDGEIGKLQSIVPGAGPAGAAIAPGAPGRTAGPVPSSPLVVVPFVLRTASAPVVSVTWPRLLTWRASET